jgi:ribonuclease BN (tRNA processing enzyme)
VQITVLGKSPSWPDAGGACSGYLVEDEATCVLLDCGSGVFSQLRRVRDYLAVDAVLISHMHADHFLDLVPFACALSYAPRQQRYAVAGWPGTDEPVRPRLHLPPGAIELLRAIAAAGGQPGLFDNAFEVSEYDVAQTLAIGTLRARFAPVPHYVPCNAVELTSRHGGGRFTFGADHGPTDALREFAARTDLLMLEASLPFAPPEMGGPPRGHLTAAEAGEHAAGCDAKRLVLTHITDELDAEQALAEAARGYAGPIEVAQTGAVYTV